MTLITIITLFGTLSGTGLPNVCDSTNPDTGTPILCDPYHAEAPVWDDTVCCDNNNCTVPNALGQCPADRKARYCEFGEQWADNSVSCYFVVPNVCDVFPCEPGFNPWPEQNTMCCYEGICWHLWADDNDCEVWDIYWCSDGVTNQDGTVTCFD